MPRPSSTFFALGIFNNSSLQQQQQQQQGQQQQQEGEVRGGGLRGGMGCLWNGRWSCSVAKWVGAGVAVSAAVEEVHSDLEEEKKLGLLFRTRCHMGRCFSCSSSLISTFFDHSLGIGSGFSWTVAFDPLTGLGLFYTAVCMQLWARIVSCSRDPLGIV